MEQDYESLQEVLNRDGAQVIMTKRYDDAPAYIVNVTTWPETEDAQGWETMKFCGFLKNPGKFRREMLANGFVLNEFTDMDPDFQRYVTYNILPIEWHAHMDELAVRVTVYTKEVK